MVVDPIPGTRVRTLLDRLSRCGVELPVKTGTVQSYLGMLVQVKWDEGPEGSINAWFLEEIADGHSQQG